MQSVDMENIAALSVTHWPARQDGSSVNASYAGQNIREPRNTLLNMAQNIALKNVEVSETEGKIAIVGAVDAQTFAGVTGTPNGIERVNVMVIPANSVARFAKKASADLQSTILNPIENLTVIMF